MRIEVGDPVAGAEAARDVAIVIDVLRAYFVIADALANGAVTQLRTAPAALKFFDHEATWAPAAGFYACAGFDALDFSVRWRRATDGLGALHR